MSRYRNVQVDGQTKMAHTAIAVAALGKPLPLGAEVHHVDGNPLNNAARNLVICQDNEYHTLLHMRADVVGAGGNPNGSKLCRQCGLCKPFGAFNKARRKTVLGLTASCRDCSKAAFKRWWTSGGSAKHAARRRQRNKAVA